MNKKQSTKKKAAAKAATTPKRESLTTDQLEQLSIVVATCVTEFGQDAIDALLILLDEDDHSKVIHVNSYITSAVYSRTREASEGERRYTAQARERFLSSGAKGGAS
jgi:hypothetical protein